MAIIKGYDMPDELYYHKDHTWVRLDSDGNVTVGMTDSYVKMAGDTTYADLPEEGDDVSQGETAGKIQSSKWVGKLVSPLSGEVIAVNEALQDDFLLINNDPYHEGWIMRIKPSNLDDELSDLMFGIEAVTAFLETEIKASENLDGR